MNSMSEHWNIKEKFNRSFVFVIAPKLLKITLNVVDINIIILSDRKKISKINLNDLTMIVSIFAVIKVVFFSVNGLKCNKNNIGK